MNTCTAWDAVWQCLNSGTVTARSAARGRPCSACACACGRTCAGLHGTMAASRLPLLAPVRRAEEPLVWGVVRKAYVFSTHSSCVAQHSRGTAQWCPCSVMGPHGWNRGERLPRSTALPQPCLPRALTGTQLRGSASAGNRSLPSWWEGKWALSASREVT